MLKTHKMLKTLKPLETLNHPLGTPNPAGNRHPKATSMALWAFKFAVCQPFNVLENASKASWNAQPRRQKLAQGHFKIPSYGRSSLPFARP